MKQIMTALRSHTCATVKLSLLQDSELSNSTQHRADCRTEAVKHLTRYLESCKMLKFILSQLKFIKYQNQWYHPRLF